jgi:hypothetical protein
MLTVLAIEQFLSANPGGCRLAASRLTIPGSFGCLGLFAVSARLIVRNVLYKSKVEQSKVAAGAAMHRLNNVVQNDGSVKNKHARS